MQKNLEEIIHFENNYSDQFSVTSHHSIFLSRISKLLEIESLHCEDLSIIWVTDDYLRQLHIDYLDDPTYTDVMTFNYGEENTIDGELYISIDRAKEHADKFRVSLEEELSRLIIHGLLHIAGYDDHSDVEKKVMREKENYYLVDMK